MPRERVPNQVERESNSQSETSDRRSGGGGATLLESIDRIPGPAK